MKHIKLWPLATIAFSSCIFAASNTPEESWHKVKRTTEVSIVQWEELKEGIENDPNFLEQVMLGGAAAHNIIDPSDPAYQRLEIDEKLVSDMHNSKTNTQRLALLGQEIMEQRAKKKRNKPEGIKDVLQTSQSLSNKINSKHLSKCADLMIQEKYAEMNALITKDEFENASNSVCFLHKKHQDNVFMQKLSNTEKGEFYTEFSRALILLRKSGYLSKEHPEDTVELENEGTKSRLQSLNLKEKSKKPEELKDILEQSKAFLAGNKKSQEHYMNLARQGKMAEASAFQKKDEFERASRAAEFLQEKNKDYDFIHGLSFAERGELYAEIGYTLQLTGKNRHLSKTYLKNAAALGNNRAKRELQLLKLKKEQKKLAGTTVAGVSF